MPTTPEPVGPPELMPFLRWVKSTLLAVVDDARRKSQADSNTNSSQNGTMNMLVERLGNLADSIQDMFDAATFSGSQITSGIIPEPRLPTGINAAKLTGAASLTTLTTSGAATVGGNVNVTGHVYVPNSTLASFGSWTVAYIDGDGRLTRGASSARYKVDITLAPDGKNYFAVSHKEFAMKGGNGWRVLGYIAEDLMGTDMERFVIFARDPETHQLVRDEQGNPIPESIDFIPMLLAQNVQLRGELTATNARLADIEARLANLEM